MSDNKQGLSAVFQACESRFLEINESNGNLLDFARECHFASQQITKSDFIMNVARNNQPSLKNAIVNCSAVGLSLNPANAHAYLVPRDGGICLDVSYKGLIKLATDTGSILWAKAVLVHESDEFVYKGPATPPEHSADVFSSDRGEIKGGYCIAKTASGDFLIETMSLAEIHEVRGTSKAYTSGKTCPWKTFFNEMAKKTLIKRASKTWPQTDQRERLDNAINIVNEHEGLQSELINYDSCSHSPEQKELLHKYMQENDGLGIYCLQLELGENIYTSLYHSFERGTKGKNQAVMDSLNEQGRVLFFKYVEEFDVACDSDDKDGARLLIEELTPNQVLLINEEVQPHTSAFIVSVDEEEAA